MTQKGEIKSDKILIKDVFKMWFRVPEYQRPYVWGYEEIQDLLDDLAYALAESPDAEYFLGSFVFQSKPASAKDGRQFDENDLLDGQQRMTTLLLLMGVIRDLAVKPLVKSKCQDYIYQDADPIENIPERTRLVFSIRPEVQEFIEEFVKADGGTTREKDLTRLVEKLGDLSVRNMASAILEMRKFFSDSENLPPDPEKLLTFLVTKVLMIYVATEDLEDAFRLFTILNDRGVPLRNSDILKSMNLGALESDNDKFKYARMWEEAEGELGDDFDRFLNHVRTILVKEKARLNLLREFEDKIYEPKEKDKATGIKKPVLLKKGKETFALIEQHLANYKTLLSGQNDDELGNFEFDNLVKIMLNSLPATDWVPPLMRYFERFAFNNLMEFLRKLDAKFSADWISGKTPTDRIEAMTDLLKVIDAAQKSEDVFSSKVFDFDAAGFLRVLNGPIYGRRFSRYITLKLDFFYQNHDQKMHFDLLSVEHILPQNPTDTSQWVKDFTQEERELWTDRLGNLVLITRGKNSSQGRLDYVDKVKNYFKKNIDTCPNSLRVLNQHSSWNINDLQGNHDHVMKEIKKRYGISA